jgi:hypothetical protein
MMTRISDHFRSLPCCVCGKTPSQANRIRQSVTEFFNLIPLCSKHTIQKENLGLENFIAKHDMVKTYLIQKGWVLNQRPIFHGDLKES